VIACKNAKNKTWQQRPKESGAATLSVGIFLLLVYESFTAEAPTRRQRSGEGVTGEGEKDLREQTATAMAAKTATKTGRAHGLPECDLGLVLYLGIKSFPRLSK
jgi:hypothetical protein